MRAKVQTPACIINGEQGDSLSSLDRGLLYGDGIFETIAIQQGQPQYWQEHLERLKLGCEILGLSGLDHALLKTEVEKLIDVDAQCIVKIIITRGVGGRGYKSTQQSLTRIIQKFPWTEYPESYTQSGIDVTLCEFRLAQQSKLAQIKHLNRLEQVLARSEWADEYQEGLVCDQEDHIIEATSSNVFFEMASCLVTPELTGCGVAGVLRNKVINYCNNNDIQLSIREFSLSEISDIQGMFVCNSVIGIWPVKCFSNLTLPKTAIIKKLMSIFNT
ncbi:MAG: aminodeoxychorismate lyase [Gammaproteobacteria bacterium]|nr:aminodeoxychorismate lyase [Gammaproteobacteria bacterium]